MVSNEDIIKPTDLQRDNVASLLSIACHSFTQAVDDIPNLTQTWAAMSERYPILKNGNAMNLKTLSRKGASHLFLQDDVGAVEKVVNAIDAAEKSEAFSAAWKNAKFARAYNVLLGDGFCHTGLDAIPNNGGLGAALEAGRILLGLNQMQMVKGVNDVLQTEFTQEYIQAWEACGRQENSTESVLPPESVVKYSNLT